VGGCLWVVGMLLFIGGHPHVYNTVYECCMRPMKLYEDELTTLTQYVRALVYQQQQQQHNGGGGGIEDLDQASSRDDGDTKRQRRKTISTAVPSSAQQLPPSLRQLHCASRGDTGNVFVCLQNSLLFCVSQCSNMLAFVLQNRLVVQKRQQRH
jgi:hypothetical protein